MTNATGAHHPFHLHGFSVQPIKLTPRTGTTGPSYTFPHEFRDIVDVPEGVHPHVPGLLGRSQDEGQSDGRGSHRSVDVPLSHTPPCHVRDEVGASRPRYALTPERHASPQMNHLKPLKEGSMKTRYGIVALISLLMGLGTASMAQAAHPAPSSKAPVVSFEAGDSQGNFFYVYKHRQLEITRVCACNPWTEIPRRHCSRRNGGVSLV